MEQKSLLTGARATKGHAAATLVQTLYNAVLLLYGIGSAHTQQVPVTEMALPS